MKPIRCLVASMLGLIFALGAFSQPASAKKVVVLLSKNLEPYQQVLQGIQGGSKHDIRRFDMNGNPETGKSILTGSDVAQADVVVTVGKEATDAAQACLSGPPLVFTMVLDAPEIKGRRFSGLLMSIKLSEQFALIKRMFPAARKICVFYNPEFSADIIQEARGVAQQANLNLIPMAVSKKEDVADALNKLSQIAPDALWSIPDRTLVTPAVVQQVAAYTADHKIPFIGLSVFHVKVGALAAFSIDLKSIGTQTAKLVDQTLAGEFPAGRIAYPERVLVFVNKKVQQRLNVKFNGLDNIQEIE